MLALGSPLHAFDFDTLHGGRVDRAPREEGREAPHARRHRSQARAVRPPDRRRRPRDRARRDHGRRGDRGHRRRRPPCCSRRRTSSRCPCCARSERLALRTEGSNRWEKGVDPYLAGPAATMATRHDRRARRRALDRCRRRAGEHADARRPDAPAGADERAARARGRGRAAVGDPRRRSASSRRSGGYRVPTWRARDVTREVDLIEEVARFVLDEIPFTLPEHDVDVRPADAVAAHPAPRRGRAGRLRLLRGVHLDLRGRRGPAPAAADLAGGRCASRVARGEPRRGGARERRGRRDGSRALRDRTHVPHAAASCRTSGGTSPASSTAASRRRSGRSSSSTRRSRSSRRSNARRSLCSIRARLRGRTRAGSASCTPRCSTASGARSSSISTHWSSVRPRSSRSRR